MPETADAVAPEAQQEGMIIGSAIVTRHRHRPPLSAVIGLANYARAPYTSGEDPVCPVPIVLPL